MSAEDLRAVGIDGCYCVPVRNVCPRCGETERLGELYLPDYTMLCLSCETRFPVTNPLGAP